MEKGINGNNGLKSAIEAELAKNKYTVEPLEYHDFRLKRVESERKNGRIKIQWEALRSFDDYQGDYVEKYSLESTYANNCEIHRLFLDLANFTGNVDADNIALTKLILADFGDYIETVQFVYETDIETDNPNTVKTSKLQVGSDFGDLTNALETKLEELKLNCWQFACQGKKFRPEKSKADINETGRVSF
jgi:hypothetical protein